MSYPIITIVGNGFGAVYTARLLLKRGFKVRIIAQENRFTFTPLLHEVATGTLCEDDVCFSFGTFIPQYGFEFIAGELAKINVSEKTLELSSGRILEYEKLVLATGARSDMSSVPGAEYAMTLKTVTDAAMIRNRLLELISSRPNEIAVNIIGGGFTGVELLCEIEQVLNKYCKNSKLIIRLFNRSSILLSESDPKLASYIEKRLRRADIEYYLNSKVEAILPDHIKIKEKTFYADLNIITTGVSLNNEYAPKQWLDLRGNIEVEKSLLVCGDKDVFALGDIITIKGYGKPPMLAQTAVRQALVVAKNIIHQINGETLSDYIIKIQGMLISLGNWDAAGRIFGISIFGRFAWYIWRTVYLFKTPGWSNRFNIAFRWTNYLFINRRHIKRKGFTLIEMLVVTGVIAVLAAFTIVSMSSSRIHSRDAQRVAYINQMNSALELYFSKYGYYPTAITAGQSLTFNGIKYLDPVPSNPSPRNDGDCADQDFVYKVYPGNTSYTISFCLGKPAGNLNAGKIICDGGNCKSCGQYSLSYDGVTYNTVSIGGQCWLGKNLNTKHKSDGTCINPGCPDASSADNGLGRSCYNNSEANCTTDGSLYAWSAAMDGSTTEGAQGICPTGWHVPSDGEQFILENYLKDSGQSCLSSRNGAGDCATAGSKIKIGGSTGFNIETAGQRGADGSSFNYRTTHWGMWSSTQSSTDAAFRWSYYNNTTIDRFIMSKTLGISLRCLKD